MPLSVSPSTLLSSLPPRVAARLLLPILLALLLSACSGSWRLETSTIRAGQTNNLNATQPSSEPDIELDSELLYQLLLAHIAAQRNHHDVAMQAMSKAAHQSEHRQIVEWAIQSAVFRKDHPRIIALTHLMERIAPNDLRTQLIRAEAQFSSGQNDHALQGLTALARNADLNTRTHTDAEIESVLQLTASLLAKQSPEVIAKFRDTVDAADSNSPNYPQLVLVAALLAYETKQPADFRQRVEQALQLRRDWETAAILKLTYLAEIMPTLESANSGSEFSPESNLKRMTTYADGFLKEFPKAKRFKSQYLQRLVEKEAAKKSISVSKSILRQDKKSSQALFASGLAYLKQGKLRKARARFKQFLKLNPRSDEARLHIAEIEVMRENFAVAIATLQQVDTPRRYLDAQVKIASIVASQHTINAGIHYLKQIATANESEEIRIVLEQVELYRDFMQFKSAKSVLDASLSEMPEQPDLLYSRGLLAVKLDLLELHERDLRKLIAQLPQHAHAHNALGYTLADETERFDEAHALISKALELLPNDPFILDSMGWVNFRLGNHDKAIEYLRYALQVKKDAEIAAHLGEVLWVVGKQREAMRIWEQGKKLAPDNTTLLDTLQRFINESSFLVPNLERIKLQYVTLSDTMRNDADTTFRFSFST